MLNCSPVAYVGFLKVLQLSSTHLFLQNIEELDPDFIMAKQVEQLEKEKKELQERLKNQEKKVIYLSDVGVQMSRILFWHWFVFTDWLLWESKTSWRDSSDQEGLRRAACEGYGTVGVAGRREGT